MKGEKRKGIERGRTKFVRAPTRGPTQMVERGARCWWGGGRDREWGWPVPQKKKSISNLRKKLIDENAGNSLKGRGGEEKSELS